MANAPDLVLRAASRLAKNEPAAPFATKDDAGSARPGVGNGVGLAGRPQLQSAPLATTLSAAAAPSQTVVLSPATLAANGIALPSSGFSRQVEEFRSIKRQVLSGVQKNASGAKTGLNRLLMVTSAAPAEGKTYVSINLALAIAFERDFSVLLVDADAHRQSLISRLGITAKHGWLDLLTDDSLAVRDIAIGTNVPNLTILPSGKARTEIPELMASRRMGELVRSLVTEDQNRLVIMDSLPCLVSTEPSILASMVGQVLFVVAASETSKEEIESSLHRLDGCASINLILNKGDPLLIDQFGKYGYGYGYPAEK
jgi:exopolysaccharide/PEP-CTERM locus tyrosine autokinase